MALTLHNYFDDYPKIIKGCDDVFKKHNGMLIPERIAAEKALLAPLVDSDELFEKKDTTLVRDKVVYIFLDSEDSIRVKKVNNDFTTNMPIAYIGMGTIDRPAAHWAGGAGVNTRFHEWIKSKEQFDKISPYLIIYSSHMSDEEAKELEADLISQVIKIQSPIYGMQAYKSTRCPIRLFNSKEETSHQRVYSVHGKRQK